MKIHGKESTSCEQERHGWLSVNLAGEDVDLVPERGLWWPKERTLFIADIHLGKAATFQRAGMPVPERSHQSDLNRLSAMLTATQAQRLVILGDFFHARQGRTPITEGSILAWRNEWPEIEIMLTEGNHDRQTGPPATELAIQYVRGVARIGPFALRHEPEPVDGCFTLAGHIHPAYRLGSIKARCFHCIDNKMLVLPSFGEFTGSKIVDMAKGDRIYLVGDEVIELPMRR